MTTRQVRFVAAVAAVLAYCVVVRLAPLPAAVGGRVSQLAVVAAAAVVGVLWCRAARWSTGRLRAGVGMLGTGVLAWALAETLWLAHGWSIDGADVPIPAAANALFAVTMIGTPVATVLMVRRPTASLRTLLDGLLIGTSLLLVVWALAIGPQYRAGATGLGSIAYSVADALIVSVLVLVIGDARPAVRPALEVAAVGMVIMFAGDSSYAYLVVDGQYRFGALPDLLWFTAFVVLAAAVPRRSTLAGEASMTERQSSRHNLPYVPFSLAFVTAVAVPIAQHRVDPALYGFSLALALFVVIRQLVTMTDNRSLTRRLSAAVDDLRFRANHDALTGLANRALFEDSLEAALGGKAGARVGVLYVDLDGFKPINDAYGHECGDRALVAVAERLLATAAPGDVVARLGGDEFAILTTTGPDGAVLLAGDVLDALRPPLDLTGRSVAVGASIGIAGGEPGASSPGQLLREADAAMYAAKRGGRNRVVAFDAALWPDPVGSGASAA
ncbi:diguanylate cyclase domain-containing protein [Actinoplanes sp. URMC 104]|uniref:diguanylate cyclase domain-containing protein n=1 Tax=Actinoplanes sp. URMC 104 TaxID=3423409 RepID=UPI003F1A3B9E